MKYKLLYVLVLLLSLNTFYLEAQSKRAQRLTEVRYKDNVKAPLNAKELAMLQEVYQDKLQDYILTNPQRLKDFKHLLRNRIEIKQMPELLAYKNKYQTLSEAGLLDAYNPNLTTDTQYNPNTFNPLKYNLKFFGRGASIYRIDHTNYFILIKSQHE